MIRSATHVVISFFVGDKDFRMRVGGDIERAATDELGAHAWIRMPSDLPQGLPSKQALMQLALTKIFSDLPQYTDLPQCTDGRVYPLGVLEGLGGVVTIHLGKLSL